MIAYECSRFCPKFITIIFTDVYLEPTTLKGPDRVDDIRIRRGWWDDITSKIQEGWNKVVEKVKDFGFFCHSEGRIRGCKKENR